MEDNGKGEKVCRDCKKSLKAGIEIEKFEATDEVQ